MPIFESIALKVGGKLIESKNTLFEVVQEKMYEGKSKDQIISELKKCFSPSSDILKEIEYRFFKNSANQEEEGISMVEINEKMKEIFDDFKKSKGKMSLEEFRKRMTEVFPDRDVTKKAFIPQIIFSDLLYDINSYWEDGLITQSEVDTIIEKYSELEDKIMNYEMSENEASKKFTKFIFPYLNKAEEREEINNKFETGLITKDEKNTLLKKISTV